MNDGKRINPLSRRPRRQRLVVAVRGAAGTGWLEPLERGEPVVVNLRLDTDAITEFVRFDGERIRRVLGRIAADRAEGGRATKGPVAEETREGTMPGWSSGAG